MSGQRAASEPYATRFEAEVTAIEDRTVWLESTHFFGESGGQPSDRGQIGGVPVETVTYESGEHVHVLAEDPPFKTGHRILCEIEWPYRMYCMRAHTAAHLFFGAARRAFDDVESDGIEICEESVRIGFRTNHVIDTESVIQLDELLNRTVWESRSVSWEDVPVSKAHDSDQIRFDEERHNDAVRSGRVRIVTIGGAEEGRTRTSFGSNNAWDKRACSGTHVRNTREVGPVTILDHCNREDGSTSIELAVGRRAIERRTAEKRLALASKTAFGVSVEGVPNELREAIRNLDGPVGKPTS